MHCYQIQFEHTYHRTTALDAAGDPTHKRAELRPAIMHVVVPEQSPYWYRAAQEYVMHCADHERDRNFRLMHLADGYLTGHAIHGILQPALTKL